MPLPKASPSGGAANRGNLSELASWPPFRNEVVSTPTTPHSLTNSSSMSSMVSTYSTFSQNS